MREWALIAQSFTGWSLTEIKELSPRERDNWIEIARESGKLVRG
jgi:hypothetical protein